MIAQIVTTPLDVARTRMMIDKKDAEGHTNNDVMNSGIFVYTSYIGKNEGMSALFVGLQPRIIRALVSGAVQFFTYETTQNAMR